MMNQDMIAYYNYRAMEYDKVYQIPEEQGDLLKAAGLFQDIFRNKQVLEVACGTGYWTAQISQTAASIHATDINQAVIDIARARDFHCPVHFEVADLNKVQTERKSDGYFGGFIWSHILVQDINEMLATLSDLLVPGADVIFIDSRQVAGTNHDKNRISRVDEYGNTFQRRHLENGTQYEVLKNFPSRNFLLEKLSPFTSNIEITELDFYWIATCKLK